jgi:hypothetical protein
LNITGEDSESCNTHDNPCKEIDYVMQTNVNVTGRNSIVYIYTDTYNYTLVTSTDSTSSTFKGYINIIFTLTTYTSSYSSFSSSDISTNPLILSNSSNSTNKYLFLLYSDISASFHYLFFFIGSNCYGVRVFIYSFFFFFFFFFFFILLVQIIILILLY